MGLKTGNIKYCFLILFGLPFFSSAQDKAEEKKGSNKNIITVSYTYLHGNDRYGDVFRGSGLELGYSRYIWKDNLYGNISYGKNYVNAPEGIFLWIDDEVVMSVFSLGAGYDFFKKNNLTLSGELHFLNLRHDVIDYRILDEDGNASTIQYGKHSDGTLRVQLRMRYFFEENFVITPVLGYGIQHTKYETLWFKIGIGYAF